MANVSDRITLHDANSVRFYRRRGEKYDWLEIMVDDVAVGIFPKLGIDFEKFLDDVDCAMNEFMGVNNEKEA